MGIFIHTLVITGGKNAEIRIGHKLKQGYIPGSNPGDIIICMYEHADVAKEAKDIMNEAIRKCHNMKKPAQ